MLELSLQTIDIIAFSKLLLLITFITVLMILRYCNKPWLLTLVAGLSIAIFYLILSWPLKKMWWGNNGDEVFIFSFLSQVLSGNALNDFYYHGLPNFYPPLYFWLTGLISRLTADNAISASKIGVTVTVFFWFIGTYFWQKLYWDIINKKSSNFIASKKWFWLLVPLILFFLTDFNDIILKPYETLPALLLVLLIGMIAESFSVSRWSYKEYLFFGISGGIIFLTYYFWWFMAIPALFTLVLFSQYKKKNFLRIIGVGGVMFGVSAIYLIPLFVSYLGGIENWQALFFVPKDLSTFLPFADISVRTLLVVGGILGLIAYHKKSFIKANIVLLFFGFVYQFVSIVLYVLGGNALQAAKPFLFLGTASIAVGSAYLLLEGWEKHIKHLPVTRKQLIVLGVVIFSLPFWPMTKFIDDPVVINQLEKDLKPPSAYYLSPKVKNNVPDYLDRTWLSSGIPEINAYMPIHYFIAHNPHFSHHASKYSERMKVLQNLAMAENEEFVKLINQTPIDALILYKQDDSMNYSFYFWADNYPNGGKELVIEIPKDKFTSLGWTKKYEDKEWIIYTK